MNTTSSSASAKRRLLPFEEKENDQMGDSNDGVKKLKITPDIQMKIRQQIFEEFCKRDLKVPVPMIRENLDGHCTDEKSLSFCFIDLIDAFKTSKTNRSDVEHRKELYSRLSSYLDRRQVRNRGETYIFPELITEMIRCRFPNDIRSYDTVKTVKSGTLSIISEEKKHYVQWEDFCKEID